MRQLAPHITATCVYDNRFNDYGGSVGGPIIHNRTFCFFSTERISNNAPPRDSGGWYETPQFRALAASGTNAAKISFFPGVAPTAARLWIDVRQRWLVEGTNCRFIPRPGTQPRFSFDRPLGTRDAAPKQYQPWHRRQRKRRSEQLANTPIRFSIKALSRPTQQSRAIQRPLDFNPTNKTDRLQHLLRGRTPAQA